MHQYQLHQYHHQQDFLPSPALTHPTIDDMMQCVDQHTGEWWALMDIMCTESIDEIISDIIKGTAVAVSDSSFKDERGTDAWIIENASGTQRLLGKVLVPGYASDHSAYRSEIAGLYGIVLMVEIIKKVWRLTKGSILVGCDGKTTLEQALQFRKNRTSSKQKHFDLLSGIQGYVRDSVISYTPLHIKGHQDRHTNLANLDWLAILNIEVDTYAKDFWTEKFSPSMDPRPYFHYHIPKGMWKVSFSNTRVVKHLSKYLRKSIEGGGKLHSIGLIRGTVLLLLIF